MGSQRLKARPFNLPNRRPDLVGVAQFVFARLQGVHAYLSVEYFLLGVGELLPLPSEDH